MTSTKWSEKSTQDQRTILWKIWTWIWYMENIYECHSQSSNSFGKWPWCEFERCTNFFLENCSTTFRGYRKVDQWSNRNCWYKPDWLQGFKVDIDELVAQSSSSIRHCQGLRLFRLGAVLGENWNESRWILEEQDSVVLREQLRQWTESNWWKANGVRVNDFPRIHDSGHPQRDSEKDGRITVWSSGLQRQDHLHVNV